MQIALVGTVGMRVTLGQRGRKDYALLNAKRMVSISFVINAFKNSFVLLNIYIYIYIYIYMYTFIIIKKIFRFSCLVLVFQMWSVLVFRNAK